MRTVVDIALAQYDVVWAAGGHPHLIGARISDEPLRITRGTSAKDRA